MTFNEAHRDSSDRSEGRTDQPRSRMGRSREKIVTQARRWGPALYTLVRIIWQIASDDHPGQL